MSKCTLKHLGTAYVLMQESLQGHPVHRYLAVGHLVEAARECGDAGFAADIRECWNLLLTEEGNLDMVMRLLIHESGQET